MRCQVCKRERCLNEMSVNVSIVWNCDRLLNEMPANNNIDSLEACLKLVSLISSWFDAFRSSVEIKRCHGNSVVGPEAISGQFPLKCMDAWLCHSFVFVFSSLRGKCLESVLVRSAE